jgi:transcriptional regulator with XRE-family HTH domain
MEKSRLSINLRKLRTFKQCSQSEFGELFQVTRASIGSYEEGRAEPKLSFLIAVAKHFKLTLDSIVTEELSVNQIAHFNNLETIDSPYIEIHKKLDNLAEQINVLMKKNV